MLKRPLKMLFRTLIKILIVEIHVRPFGLIELLFGPSLICVIGGLS